MCERLPPPAVAEGCFRPGHGSAVPHEYSTFDFVQVDYVP